MKTSIMTAALCLATAGTAAAQPGMTSQVPDEPQPEVRTAEPKSEHLALTLSLGGTLGSLGLMFGAASVGNGNGNGSMAAVMGTAGALGFVLGPSFGHWYAGKYFTRGLGCRLAGGGALFGAMVLALANYDGGQDAGAAEGLMDAAIPILMLTGAVLYVSGTLDDIVTAPRRVRRHNERLKDVAVAPLAVSHGGGLGLTGRF